MEKLTKAELRHLVWRNREIRVPLDASVGDMVRLLNFEVGFKAPENPINAKRDELITFIRDNTDRLSLPCDGNCYSHHDVMVLHCHAQLVQGTTDD